MSSSEMYRRKTICLDVSSCLKPIPSPVWLISSVETYTFKLVVLICSRLGALDTNKRNNMNLESQRTDFKVFTQSTIPSV